MQETIKKMLEKYQDKQMTIVIEELSELQKEICKKLRGYNNDIHLCEEVADVMICLHYLIEYYNLDKMYIEEIKDLKIKRTRELYL
jgi:NTP pyrophosphatase (non-canonical NTP hydrolase)